MSDGYRNGAFALGLIVGGGIVLNLFLWLDYRARSKIEPQTGASHDAQYSQVGEYWDGFVGTFVSPSDTLAQWIMAFFTIAATVVLILTLRSANKTNIAAVKASEAALDANQIMRKEQRPWLKVEIGVEGNLFENDGEIRAIILVRITNIGTSPAITSSFIIPEVVCEFDVVRGLSMVDVESKVFRARKTIEKNDLGFRVIFPNDQFTLKVNTAIPEHTTLSGSGYSNPLVVFPCVYRSTEGGETFQTVVFRKIVRIKSDGSVSAVMISLVDLSQDGDSLGVRESHVISDKVA